LSAIVDDTEEEPIYQYVPGNLGSSQSNVDAFTQSLLLLADGAESGALLHQYEQLYRRNQNLAITEAKKPEYANKNRYRDISPCKYFLYISIIYMKKKNLLVWFQTTALE
jgi:tyrosine-protein phosphatase non-receptor type 4